MITLQRQKQFLEYIAARQSAQVTELGSAFGVSLSTVRRDLKEMEQSGLVRRVHGGAVLAEQRDESPLTQRALRYPQL
jgi:DeoR/GlpR family transcriptional regulator of sugar metabolism